jgi:predicted nucleic acid-binding protein
MVVFDANFLIFFLDPKLREGAGNNPRVDHLVETIDQNRDRIIVPTPALSELLVGAKDAAPKYLDTINRSRYFRIEPFGERAAVEAAAMTRDAISRGAKLGPAIESSWAKVKFDRQIVAIGRVAGAHAIYSQDPDVARHAIEVGMKVLRLEDLPDPPTPPQIEMTLETPESEPAADPDETE